MEIIKTRIYPFITYVVLSLILSSCNQDQIIHTREESISNIQQDAQPRMSFNAEKSITMVDEYMNTLVCLNKFCGSVLIAHNGTVLIRKGYGMANRKHGSLIFN